MHRARSLTVTAGVVAGLMAATAAHAQVVDTGAVGGATRVGAGADVGVGVRTPQDTGQVDQARRTAQSAAQAGGGAALTATHGVEARTAAMLDGITLTAQQKAAVDAHATAYAARLQELEGAAGGSASAETGAAAVASADAAKRAGSDAGQHAAKATTGAGARASAQGEKMREAAAEYRARVRSVLTAEQQKRFDANVKAEVDARGAAGRP